MKKTVKSEVSPEISKYFSDLGKKGGASLLKQKGREYYSKISKMRKSKNKIIR